MAQDIHQAVTDSIIRTLEAGLGGDGADPRRRRRIRQGALQPGRDRPLVSAREAEAPRWLFRAALFALPLPWIAIEFGWFVAEFGCASGRRIACMKSGSDAGWLSSGVPEIGTKGTTKG